MRDGETGYLVGVGEIEAIAERAIEILSDPVRQREMGRRGRQWAIEQFATDRVIPQYVALYERVLQATSNAHSRP